MSTTAWRLRQRSLELLGRLVRVTNLVLRLNSGISSRNQTPLFAQAYLAADNAWPASYRESASVRSFAAAAAPSTGWVANDLPFRAEPASGIVRGRSPGRRQGRLRRDRRSDRDWGARWTMPEPSLGAPPEGPASCPRPSPPPGLGRRDGAGRLVVGGRVMDAARRAGPGGGGPRDDALGAADARGRTARVRAAAVPRGNRPARARRGA